jgi:hypothetical protein
MTYGNQLEVIVFGENRPYLSFPALLLGELWLNFGFLGVLAGSVLFGWVLKKVATLRSFGQSTVAISVYPLIFLGVMTAYPTSLSWAFRSVWIRIVVPVGIALYVAQWTANGSLRLPIDSVTRQREK